MRKHFFSLGVMIAILGMSAGCAETRYVPYRESSGNNESIPLSREVAYEVGREFYVDMPDTVCILFPKAKGGQQHYAQLVERELTHSLRGKISRVVGSTERRIAIRELALTPDLDDPEVRRLLAKHLDCETFVFSKVEGGPTNLLVWSQFSLSINARLEKVSNGNPLWRARTEATRSDGGLPLSPGSIISNTFFSARFAADEVDVTASVIADAVRRIVHTLPDARRFP